MTMEEKDGKWDVSSDDDNMDGLVKLLTGSTAAELQTYMYSLFGGSLA